MALFDLILFSEIRGIVVRNGAPVEGAEIAQDLSSPSEGRQHLRRTATDAQGGFRLPRVSRFSVFGRLVPREPAISQTITIHHHGKDYEGWLYFKNDYDDNSELNGRAINLVCDLEREPKFGGDSFGICRAMT